MTDMNDVVREARKASDHPALEGAARVGYAVSGVLHLVIGWIALQVAWGLGGGSGKRADQAGALQSLSGNGLGQAVLWLGVLGFLGLGLWQLADTAFGHPGSDKEAWGGRVKALSKAAVYLALAWTTFGFARGKSSNSKQQTVDFTSSLMDKPGGRWLVGLVGLVIIGVGGYHVWKGATEGFLRDLEKARASGPPARGSSATSPRAWPSRSWGLCSSPQACTATPRSPPASTARCAP